MRRNRLRIGLESLEERFALSAFGQVVASQAQDDGAAFGQHQSEVARDLIYTDGVNGLGEFNRNGGPLTNLK